MSAPRGWVRVGQLAYGICVTLVLLAATWAAAVVMLADIAREAQQQGLLAP